MGIRLYALSCHGGTSKSLDAFFGLNRIVSEDCKPTYIWGVSCGLAAVVPPDGI